MSAFRRRLFLINSLKGGNTFIFRINPTPSDATVTLNGVISNNITVNKGESVNWVVSKDGYITKTGTEDNITMNITKNIILEEGVKEYIQFSDSEVERICIANWSSDGIGLTKSDAEKITSLETKFSNNKVITNFDEFSFFTSVDTISSSAFAYCSSLESISFHEGIKYIKHRAFLQTSNLNIQVNFPNLETIGLKAFENSGITSIDSLGKVEILTENCFAYCSNLKYVELPNTINAIEKNVFFRDNNLSEFIIKSSIPPTLGENAFYGTSSDFLIYVPDESIELYKNSDGWSIYTDKIRPLSEYVE